MTPTPTPRPTPLTWATIPNAVTMVRFVLLLPVCWMLVDGGPDTRSVVLLLAWALTDWIDGMLARSLDQTSRWGEVLDPIADRIGLVGIIVALALAGLLPWTVLVVIAAGDLAASSLAGREALHGGIRVSRIGKVRTVVLMTAVFLLASAGAWAPGLVPTVLVLLWTGAALHLLASIGYVISARSARSARLLADQQA